MKKISIFMLSMGLSVSAFGQLTSVHNSIRSGDELIKQQVEYQSPGNGGKGIVWDFSGSKTINDEYKLGYSLPAMIGDSLYIMAKKTYDVKRVLPDELIVGTEHNTMYYYHFRNDSLFLLGHENPAIRLKYKEPILFLPFPMNYGQMAQSNYSSQGLYSNTVDIYTRGTVTTYADAFGKIILPTGDSLNPVLRVKNIQTIAELEGDSLVISNNQVETYRWYTKGYRYPVFETVRNINLRDNSEVFATAFFFPLQDHLYLETDPENLALIEENWNMDRQGENGEQTDENTKSVFIEDIVSCKIYPNPVESLLTLDYEVKLDAKIAFEIYSMDGMPVKRVKAQDRKPGRYYESIDCSNLYPRNYILRITVNNLVVNEKIIKK
ncbi:T9SS type A sorting domain-containing protein [Dysgonomonas sp. ZJ709]|uniref:T9SS type A sorting domain-containing protein n=1 Tax=Dysgonomonas sp. ZJ709 TaxID=2709797 RepID=UPI0013EDFE84|nr:T9SS type A sorting domain-containing protein [Dysgonomonas sp. ZJ709]